MIDMKLLLLHGALGSKAQFNQIKEILKGSFELHDLNFEGHGGRASNEDFSMQLFTENVVSYLDEQGIQKINIFGYSMGGYVGLNTALTYPDRIGKIVTLGTKFNWSKAAAEKEVKMLNPDKIKEKVPKFADKLKAEHHPLDWELLMHKTAKMMLALSEGGSLEEEELKSLSQEVILGVGGQDKMVTVEESEHISKLIPGGQFKLIEGFPHPIDRIDAIELSNYIKDSYS